MTQELLQFEIQRSNFNLFLDDFEYLQQIKQINDENVNKIYDIISQYVTFALTIIDDQYFSNNSMTSRIIKVFNELAFKADLNVMYISLSNNKSFQVKFSEAFYTLQKTQYLNFQQIQHQVFTESLKLFCLLLHLFTINQNVEKATISTQKIVIQQEPLKQNDIEQQQNSSQQLKYFTFYMKSIIFNENNEYQQQYLQKIMSLISVLKFYNYSETVIEAKLDLCFQFSLKIKNKDQLISINFIQLYLHLLQNINQDKQLKIDEMPKITQKLNNVKSKNYYYQRVDYVRQQMQIMNDQQIIQEIQHIINQKLVGMFLSIDFTFRCNSIQIKQLLQCIKLTQLLDIKFLSFSDQKFIKSQFEEKQVHSIGNLFYLHLNRQLDVIQKQTNVQDKLVIYKHIFNTEIQTASKQLESRDKYLQEQVIEFNQVILSKEIQQSLSTVNQKCDSAYIKYLDYPPLVLENNITQQIQENNNINQEDNQENITDKQEQLEINTINKDVKKQNKTDKINSALQLEANILQFKQNIHIQNIKQRITKNQISTNLQQRKINQIMLLQRIGVTLRNNCYQDVIITFMKTGQNFILKNYLFEIQIKELYDKNTIFNNIKQLNSIFQTAYKHFKLQVYDFSQDQNIFEEAQQADINQFNNNLIQINEYTIKAAIEIHSFTKLKEYIQFLGEKFFPCLYYYQKEVLNIENLIILLNNTLQQNININSLNNSITKLLNNYLQLCFIQLNQLQLQNKQNNEMVAKISSQLIDKTQENADQFTILLQQYNCQDIKEQLQLDQSKETLELARYQHICCFQVNCLDKVLTDDIYYLCRFNIQLDDILIEYVNISVCDNCIIIYDDNNRVIYEVSYSQSTIRISSQQERELNNICVIQLAIYHNMQYVHLIIDTLDEHCQNFLNIMHEKYFGNLQNSEEIGQQEEVQEQETQ